MGVDRKVPKVRSTNWRAVGHESLLYTSKEWVECPSGRLGLSNNGVRGLGSEDSESVSLLRYQIVSASLVSGDSVDKDLYIFS